MKLKTIAIFGVIAVAQVALAQSSMPSDKLPSLRTQMPVRSQIDKSIAPKFSGSTTKDDDVAKVVPVKCTKPTGKFPWNFDKVKVTDIVDQVSRLTCRNFIVSSSVKSTTDLTIMSRTPVNVDQAWQAFLSALESNGLAVVEVGSYYKIIQRADAQQQNLPVYAKGDELPNNEGMITLLYDVRNISKDIANTLITGLKTKAGNVISVGDTFLVISDSSANVRRMLRILERVDVPGAANRINFVTLTYAKAADIQKKLEEIFDKGSSSSSRNSFLSAAARADRIRAGLSDTSAGGDTGNLQKIISDERTNKLIIIASDKAYDRMKEIIDLLDVPSTEASAQAQVNVYTLKNGDAEKMAATLTSLVQGSSANRNTAAGRGAFGPIQEGAVFENEIKVTADKATNSLVVMASPRDFRALSQVIAKLDKERVQVYVEAVIMDIGLKDMNDLGLSLYAGIKTPIPGMSEGGLGIFGNPGGQTLSTDVMKAVGSALTTSGVSSAATAAAGIAPFVGNAIGLMGLAPIPLPGGGSISIPSLGIALKALQTSSNTDVLSTPSLMTLDNEEAKISVGDSIPYASGVSTVGTATNALGGLNLATISRLDAKLNFGITPSVNDDNFVKLKINQDITELGDLIEVPGAGKQYRTRTKTATTTVMAKDQQTIVIGGLISDRKSNSDTKTPLLGDIPIFGWLFKNNHKEKEKGNLMLVLTPYVVRSQDDLQKIYQRKLKEREDFAKLYFGDKVTKYDPYVDYTKKSGPLDHLVNEIDTQMQKIENGGPGIAGETVIRPEADKANDKEVKLNSTVPDLPADDNEEPVLVPPPTLDERENNSIEVQPVPQESNLPPPGL